MRRFSAFAALPTVAALMLIVAATGCQSNSDRDLIARDRRMQENQIYALQDYVRQYQQLVCRYRAENAALRRQLSDESPVLEVPISGRSLAPPAPSARPTTNAPEFQTPIPPGAKESPSPPPTSAPAVPPAAPPASAPKNDSLLVPPLKSTRSGRSPRYADQSSNVSSFAEMTASLQLASHEQATEVSATGATTKASDRPQVRSSAASSNSKKPISSYAKFGASISGEVVANGSGGGPRLMVDVVPPAASDETELFEGKVSLMLLVDGSHGRKRNLGRWDFTRDDVHAARRKGDNERALRFFIELPANVAASEGTQLWARLMPLEGGKTLLHTAIDLSGPGTFSSIAAVPQREDKPAAEHEIGVPPAEEAIPGTSNDANPVATASYETAAAPEQESVDRVATAFNDSSWSIAMPGKPANLPAESSEASGHGGWRLSSESIPTELAGTQVQEGTSKAESPTAKLPVLKRLATKSESTEERPVSGAPVPNIRPSWSSQRSGGVSERTAVRPNWSSKR